ncbi:4-hydroxythreonine-4-phosphate dehydrogenase PdxA [Paracoccaceae bacterium]|nr:4-hydroxythreonine-4-phosphate dehydrogenase PdxA [Paracoccaceae bacterium]
MGDPAGIGPEVLLKSYKKAKETQNLVAISDFSKIQYLADRHGVRLKKINYVDEADGFKDHLNILHLNYNSDFSPGKYDIKNSGSIIESIQIATELCLSKKVGAMVTGPINKSILRNNKAFKCFTGHTDYIEHLCGCEKGIATMMMSNPHLKIVPLTIHEPLNKVPLKIKKAIIEKKILLILSEVKKYFQNAPKIAVLGLNPHAGENGQIGYEEKSEILPAILNFKGNKDCTVDGPFPADGFFGSKDYENYDVTLAMYHDQALIPLKLLAFSETINVTLGLPIIRTSPGHGTAIKIAKDFQADCNSFFKAILFADKMMARL